MHERDAASHRVARDRVAPDAELVERCGETSGDLRQREPAACELRRLAEPRKVDGDHP